MVNSFLYPVVTPTTMFLIRLRAKPCIELARRLSSAALTLIDSASIATDTNSGKFKLSLLLPSTVTTLPSRDTLTPDGIAISLFHIRDIFVNPYPLDKLPDVAENFTADVGRLRLFPADNTLRSGQNYHAEAITNFRYVLAATINTAGGLADTGDSFNR